METGSEKLKSNIAESIELQPFDLFYMYLIYWEACMIDSLIILLYALQQNTIIIHDKPFIIAILFAEENVTVWKSLREDIFTYLFIFLSRNGNSVHEKFIEARKFVVL
jgi:hypothetical protein